MGDIKLIEVLKEVSEEILKVKACDLGEVFVRSECLRIINDKMEEYK